MDPNRRRSILKRRRRSRAPARTTAGPASSLSQSPSLASATSAQTDDATTKSAAPRGRDLEPGDVSTGGLMCAAMRPCSARALLCCRASAACPPHSATPARFGITFARPSRSESIRCAATPGAIDQDDLPAVPLGLPQLLPSDRELIVARWTRLQLRPACLATDGHRPERHVLPSDELCCVGGGDGPCMILSPPRRHSWRPWPDGETVDWERARRRAAEGASPFVANLQVIDRIAKASLRYATASEAVQSRGRTALLLAALLLTLAAGQVVGGVPAMSPVSRAWPHRAPVAIATVLVFAAASSWLGLGGRADPGHRAWHLLPADCRGIRRRFLPVPRPACSQSPRGTRPRRLPHILPVEIRGPVPRTVRFGRATASATSRKRESDGGVFCSRRPCSSGPPHAVAAGCKPVPSVRWYWGILLGLALPALPVAWWRSRSAPPRKDGGRDLHHGLLVGTAPMLVDVVLEVVFPRFSQ